MKYRQGDELKVTILNYLGVFFSVKYRMESCDIKLVLLNDITTTCVLTYLSDCQVSHNLITIQNC